MAIKDILVVLDPQPQRAVPFAISFANAFDAHVTAAAPVIVPAIPSYAIAEIPGDLLQGLREEGRAAARKELETFEAAARLGGLNADSVVLEGVTEGAGQQLAGLARHFDLTVIRQGGAREAGGQDMLIEALLFASGRPVLIAPYIQSRPAAFDRILVAWDGGAAAARAIGDAMPVLRRAKKVELLVVDNGRAPAVDLPGFNITRHLARHAISAELRRIHNVGDVANSLLSYAADVDADMLVMGGYGHSRLREFVLGGATRGILASMTIPILMAH